MDSNNEAVAEPDSPDCDKCPTHGWFSGVALLLIVLLLGAFATLQAAPETAGRLLQVLPDGVFTAVGLPSHAECAACGCSGSCPVEGGETAAEPGLALTADE